MGRRCELFCGNDRWDEGGWVDLDGDGDGDGDRDRDRDEDGDGGRTIVILYDLKKKENWLLVFLSKSKNFERKKL